MQSFIRFVQCILIIFLALKNYILSEIPFEFQVFMRWFFLEQFLVNHVIALNSELYIHIFLWQQMPIKKRYIASSPRTW